MQLSKIDMNLFIVFDTIYSERNLTKAADVLHITQPAVSNALARLRGHFNDELFVRQSGQMVPTPLTENIIERVREALAKLQSSLNEHDAFDPGDSARTFRFSMNDTSEAYVLPRLMELLEVQAPNINVESYTVPRADMVRAFSAGELDLALDVPIISHTELINTPLATDRYVCVARAQHPRIQGKLSLDAYMSESHIHVSSRKKGGGQIDAYLGRLGLQRNIKLRIQHSRAGGPIVARTDMLLTIPQSLTRGTDLQVLELPFAIPMLDWHLYWAARHQTDRAHQWMREKVFEIFRERG
jgi:DNA-binding transcriptional LysR family regulator